MHIKTSIIRMALALIVLVYCSNAPGNTPAAADDRTLTLPMLTQENARFTVFDGTLKEHSFTQQAHGTFIGDRGTSGTLEHLAEQSYRWTDGFGQQHLFQGSQYIGVDTQPGAVECVPSAQTDESDEENCDTQTQGAHAFTTQNHGVAHILLDARPESCQSYFVQYYGTQRGSEIESGLRQHPPYQHMQATIRTFPVIDFIDDDAFYVTHSRDLGNRTFNSPARPDALLQQLLDDGEEVQTRFIDVLESNGSVSASELGNTTTISAGQLRPIVMQLIIRDGIASASHWQQIAHARAELQARYGITLQVVIIP